MPCTTRLVEVPIKVQIPPKIVTYERGIRNLVAGNFTDSAQRFIIGANMTTTGVLLRKADIKEIMTYLEAFFNIDLGDYYRTYITIKDRKKDRTSFLSSLIKKLIQKMDEDDCL